MLISLQVLLSLVGTDQETAPRLGKRQLSKTTDSDNIEYTHFSVQLDRDAGLCYVRHYQEHAIRLRIFWCAVGRLRLVWHTLRSEKES